MENYLDFLLFKLYILLLLLWILLAILKEVLKSKNLLSKYSYTC